MDTLWQDLRYGIRMLLRSPGFTVVAVLTLALGIGANTAIFSVIHGVLLRSLPYPEPDQLVAIQRQFPRGVLLNVSATQFIFWRDHSQAFEAITAVIGAGFNVAGGVEPVHVPGLKVSAGFFRVLGVSPALGRGFLPEEERPDGPRVTVLSHSLWQRQFGGDPDLVGQSIFINGERHTVVGVMPPGFRFIDAEVWIPLRLTGAPEEKGANYQLIARIRRGLTVEQVRAEMHTLFEQYRRTFPNLLWQGEQGVHLVRLHEILSAGVRETLWILFGAVGLVLLIACANVASLLLGRAAARHREMAIRLALGASRGHIMGQLLTESVLLALLGGAAGILFALWGLDALLALRPEQLPHADRIGLHLPVLGFTLLLSFLTGISCGLAPAIQASNLDLNRSLKEGHWVPFDGPKRHRVHNALVVGEIALSMILLVGAGLLTVSFIKLLNVDLGFDPQGLLTMQLPLPSEKYQTTAAVWDFEQRVLERIQALPGVEAAASTSSLPLERGLNIPFQIEGRPETLIGDMEYRAVSPDYFRTLGIHVLRGRAFGATDVKSSTPVVIINEALARRFWLDRDPIGDWILIGMGKDYPEPPRQIVGVVSNIRDFRPDVPPQPTVFVPRAQVADWITVMMNQWLPAAVVIRTAAPLAPGTLRRIVQEVDPQQPVMKIRTMPQVMGDTLRYQRFVTLLMTVLAGLALVLAIVGIYSVMAYSVAQRTREFGIRLALGGRTQDISHLVLRWGLSLTGVGVGIGLVGTVGLTRLLQSFLFEIKPTDPMTLAGVAILLTGVALLACYIPARRAARVDSMVALRYE